jgi:hypothetical protein
MYEWILDFAEENFNIMPIRSVSDGECSCGHPECQNQYKHPKISGWTKKPVQPANEIQALIDNKVFAQSYGIVLSDTDFVVDFDPRNNENAIEDLNAAVGFDIESECEFIVTTGSGGKHFYFKKPSDVKISKNIRELKGIDFLSKGSFVVGCGSMHKSGFEYEITAAKKSSIDRIGEAPERLIAYVEKTEVVQESSYEAGSSDIDELKSALMSIPNDETVDYDFWLSIGMALSFETGSSDNGFALWDEWSGKSSKHDYAQMSMKWDSFSSTSNIPKPFTAGTIFKFAFDNGWEQDYGADIDLSEFVRRFEESKHDKFVIKKEDDSTLELNDTPIDLQNISGVMGQIVKYTLNTAKYPLYMPSINGALALCSTILGRDFVSDFDNYTSLYVMSVAETGTGKEHPFKVISKIMYSANQAQLIKGEVTGKSAIVTELYSNPRALFYKDEMAHWMQIVGSKNASENKLSEVKSWMELFSKQDSTYSSDSFTNLSEILKGKAEDIGENSITILKPSVTLKGATTPQKLSEAMTRMMISDGFLNRFIIMFAQEGDQKMSKNRLSSPVPQEVLSWIETIERRVLHHNKSGGGQGRNVYSRPLNPIEIPFNEESYELLDQYEDNILKRKKELRKDGLELMIVRNREKAMRISLIMELSRDPYATEITEHSVRFAVMLVDFCFEQLIEYIQFEMVENSTDKRYKEAYEAIERYEEKGVLNKDLMMRSPFKSVNSKDRSEMIHYLINESCQVRMKPEGEGRGRKAYRYFASKYVEDEE